MMTADETKAMQEIIIMGELAKRHDAELARLADAPLTATERRRFELMLRRAQAEENIAVRRLFGRSISLYEKLIEALDRQLAEFGTDKGSEH